MGDLHGRRRRRDTSERRASRPAPCPRPSSTSLRVKGRPRRLGRREGDRSRRRANRAAHEPARGRQVEGRKPRESARALASHSSPKRPAVPTHLRRRRRGPDAVAMCPRMSLSATSVPRAIGAGSRVLQSVPKAGGRPTNGTPREGAWDSALPCCAPKRRACSAPRCSLSGWWVGIYAEWSRKWVMMRALDE